MKPTHLPAILVFVGGCLLLLSTLLSMPPMFKPNVPAVEHPQERLARLVEPIAAADFTRDDAAALGEFCLAFADVIDRDAEAKLLADTGDIRDVLDESSRLMFQATGLDQRHPTMPATINGVLAKWLEIETADGVEVVDLDGDKNRRALASEVFRAIAWAVEQ